MKKRRGGEKKSRKSLFSDVIARRAEPSWKKKRGKRRNSFNWFGGEGRREGEETDELWRLRRSRRGLDEGGEKRGERFFRRPDEEHKKERRSFQILGRIDKEKCY